ncbi:MAG: NAD(P)-binding domain-containing protein, partial [Bacteroidetes bacterium]|nr:NAD(P)-binding domain-containing protein [Bacteroidota bacterium]
LPRRLNIPGEDLPHVTHYYDEPYRYTASKAVIVGGANSAVEVALDLYRNHVSVSLVHIFAGLDPTAKYWIRPDLENRIKKEEVMAYFETKVTHIEPGKVHLQHLVSGDRRTLDADFVFLMTGYRPDADFLQKIGIELKGDAFIPVLKPQTYETNIAGIYMAGSVVGGEETAKIFIENGKLHAQPIIADIQKRLS